LYSGLPMKGAFETFRRGPSVRSRGRGSLRHALFPVTRGDRTLTAVKPSMIDPATAADVPISSRSRHEGEGHLPRSLGAAASGTGGWEGPVSRRPRRTVADQARNGRRRQLWLSLHVNHHGRHNLDIPVGAAVDEGDRGRLAASSWVRTPHVLGGKVT